MVIQLHKVITLPTVITVSRSHSELLLTTISTPTLTQSKTGTEQAQQEHQQVVKSTNKPLAWVSTPSLQFLEALPRPQRPQQQAPPPARSCTRTTTRKRRCSASSSLRFCRLHHLRSGLEQLEVLLEALAAQWATVRLRVAMAACLEQGLVELVEEVREVSRRLEVRRPRERDSSRRLRELLEEMARDRLRACMGPG